jgi:hypothetical protein
LHDCIIEHLFESVKCCLRYLLTAAGATLRCKRWEHVFDRDKAVGGEMPRTEPTRALSVRLPSDLFVDLEQLARFNQASLAQEVREAVQQHLARQLSDEAFFQKVEDDLQGLKRLRHRYGAGGRDQTN